MLISDNLFVIENGKAVRPSEVGHPVEVKNALALTFNNGVTYITSRDACYMDTEGNMTPTDLMARNFKTYPITHFKEELESGIKNSEFEYTLDLGEVTKYETGSFDITDNDFAYLCGFMVGYTSVSDKPEYFRRTGKMNDRVREIMDKYIKNGYDDIGASTFFKHSWLMEVIDALFDLSNPSVMDDLIMSAHVNWLKQFFKGVIGEPIANGKLLLTNAKTNNINFLHDLFAISERTMYIYSYSLDSTQVGYTLRSKKKLDLAIVDGNYLHNPTTLYDIGYREKVNISGLIIGDKIQNS